MLENSFLRKIISLVARSMICKENQSTLSTRSFLFSESRTRIGDTARAFAVHRAKASQSSTISHSYGATRWIVAKIWGNRAHTLRSIQLPTWSGTTMAVFRIYKALHKKEQAHPTLANKWTRTSFLLPLFKLQCLHYCKVGVTSLNMNRDRVVQHKPIWSCIAFRRSINQITFVSEHARVLTVISVRMWHAISKLLHCARTEIRTSQRCDLASVSVLSSTLASDRKCVQFVRWIRWNAIQDNIACVVQPPVHV